MLRRGVRRVHWAPTALIAYLGAGFVSFGVISPPEHCPEIGVADLRAGAEAAAGWLIANQRPDGSYLYQYEREGDVVPDDYNVVRHSGVVMSLYMAGAYDVPGSFESAERGLVWSLERLTSVDDWQAAGDRVGAPSVGATALLVSGLVQRRDQTADTRYDELLASMGRFLVGQVEPSGAVSARYDMDAGGPTVGAYSIYYTGEAYWALVQLQRVFPDGPWSDAATRVGAYIAGPRDEAEDMNHVRDHWAAYGMSETNASSDAAHNRALSADQIAYARHQAEISGTTVRWLSQERGPWGVLVRGGHSELRGGGFGTIGEALTRLWRVARAEPELDDVRDSLASRVTCLAAMTLHEQAGADDAKDAADPAQVHGAWFIDGVTRMDDQQHALSALLQAIDVVEGTTPAAPSRGDHERPSQWLWVVALVAAFNPAKIARLVRRHDREPGQARSLGIAAGASLALVLLAALVADRLLDALDVSNPAYRVSAGALGGLAGIVALLRRDRSPDDDVEPPVAAGLRMSVSVASASVVALTIGAAADRGVGLVMIAVVLAAVLTAGAVMMPAGPVSKVLLQIVERAAAAVLVLAAVLLIVAGVMAV
jgi:hypothetical protein